MYILELIMDLVVDITPIIVCAVSSILQLENRLINYEKVRDVILNAHMPFLIVT